jgi:hypothetical protein
MMPGLGPILAPGPVVALIKEELESPVAVENGSVMARTTTTPGGHHEPSCMSPQTPKTGLCDSRMIPYAAEDPTRLSSRYRRWHRVRAHLRE